MWADRLNRRRRQMKRLHSSRRRHRPYFRRGSIKASPGCGCQRRSRPRPLGPDKDGNTQLHLAVLTLRTRMHEAPARLSTSFFSLTDLGDTHDTPYAAGMRALLGGGHLIDGCFRELAKIDDPHEDRKKLNKKGWLPLHLLLRCDKNFKLDNSQLDPDVVERLATMDTVNIPETFTGQTSMHMAVQMGRVDIVRVLLGMGGSFYLAAKDKETPVSLAVRQKRIDILEMMANNDRPTFCRYLQNDPNLLEIPVNKRYRDAPKMLQYLLDNGAVPVSNASYWGPMELHCAWTFYRVRVPERMLERLIPTGGIGQRPTLRFLRMIHFILQWQRPAPDFYATLACVLWHFPAPYTFAMITVEMYPFSHMVVSITPSRSSEPIDFTFQTALAHVPIFLDILSELDCWGPMQLTWYMYAERDKDSIIKWEKFIIGKQQQFNRRTNIPTTLKRICLWTVRKIIRRVPRSRFDIVAELQLPKQFIEDLTFSRFVDGLQKVWDLCPLQPFWR